MADEVTQVEGKKSSTTGGPKAIAERMAGFGIGPLAGKEQATEQVEQKVEQKTEVKQPEVQSTEKKTIQKPSPSTIPAPKKVEAKVEAKAEDPQISKVVQDGTAGMTKVQRDEYIKTKEDNRAAQKRIQELEKISQEYDLTKKQIQELKEAKEKVDKDWNDAQRDLSAHRITQTKQYKDSISTPLTKLAATEFTDENGNKQIGAIPRICKDLNIDYGVVWKAMANPNEVEGDKALSEALDGVADITKRRIERMIDDVRDLNRKAFQLENDSVKAYQAWKMDEEKNSKESQKKQRETYEAAFEASKNEVLEKIEFLKDDKGELTQDAKEAFDQALNSNFQEFAPDTQAFIMQAGYIIPMYQTELDKRNSRIEELEEALAKASKKPGMATGTSKPKPKQEEVQSTEKEKAVAEGKTAGDRFRRNFWDKQ